MDGRTPMIVQYNFSIRQSNYELPPKITVCYLQTWTARHMASRAEQASRPHILRT